jgi:hypothetical protein
LKQQTQELKNSMSVDNVANALREVKEYAARANEINVDTLNLNSLCSVHKSFDEGFYFARQRGLSQKRIRYTCHYPQYNDETLY